LLILQPYGVQDTCSDSTNHHTDQNLDGNDHHSTYSFVRRSKIN
jgi:hypothetical protein